MKQIVTLIFAIVAWASASALASPGVPYAHDLQRDGALAREKKGVILVMFSGSRCSYCETVLNEFLIPMSRNREYQDKVVMRKVETSSYREMKDFRGSKTVYRHFSGDHGVRMVPTVMIFDSEGNRLTKPVIGLTTVDYYGQFLDDAIDQGVARVRAVRNGR